MKKARRRRGRSPPSRFDKYGHDQKSRLFIPTDVEDALPPSERVHGEEESSLGRENPFASKSNRCTYYRPSNEDFGQLTDMVLPPEDVSYYQKLLQDIVYDPDTPVTTKPELKNACQGSTIQTRSAFVEPASTLRLDERVTPDAPATPDPAEDAQWQAIDSISDADMFLPVKREMPKVTGNLNQDLYERDSQWENIDRISDADVFLPSAKKKEKAPKISDGTHTPSIRISKTPRVKRIAEKFSKFKQNNLELRKLEERVVCLEYDIYDLNAADPAVPWQKMRAFFSITINGKNDKENISSIPSGVKRNFNVKEEDLQKLNKKEIEIIDEKIPENRALLEDLMQVLRRKQALENKKKQQTLDLLCLYEMAKREYPPMSYDYSNTNLLSKAELQEIKDLILKKCESSVYGINRRTVKCSEDTADDTKCVVSNSLMYELLREAGKV